MNLRFNRCSSSADKGWTSNHCEYSLFSCVISFSLTQSYRIYHQYPNIPPQKWYKSIKITYHQRLNIPPWMWYVMQYRTFFFSPRVFYGICRAGCEFELNVWAGGWCVEIHLFWGDDLTAWFQHGDTDNVFQLPDIFHRRKSISPILEVLFVLQLRFAVGYNVEVAYKKKNLPWARCSYGKRGKYVTANLVLLFWITKSKSKISQFWRFLLRVHTL